MAQSITDLMKVPRDGAPPVCRDRDEQIESIAAYTEWQMDCDRKATGLKALQG
jgi:hypothetical protein